MKRRIAEMTPEEFREFIKGPWVAVPDPSGCSVADAQFLLEVMPRVARIMGWEIQNGSLFIPLPQWVQELVAEHGMPQRDTVTGDLFGGGAS